jgi:hypothetical protein
MQQNLTEQDLQPTQPHLLRATVEALKERVEPSAIEKFVQEAAGPATPAPIGATANVKIAVWGKVFVEPDDQPWVYDNTIWGGPAFFGEAIGFMYTAYETWDAFFQNVTSCHVQGISEPAGILQINWFIADATPVGQFNGVAGGIGLLEAGGAGTWSHK